MGTLPEPSNEQKLTYIYNVLKAQENRRKRKVFMGVMKFLLIISVVALAYMYRSQLMENSYKLLSETINESIKKVSEKQKADILRGVQQLLPPGLGDTLRDVQKAVQSATGETTTPTESSASTKSTSTKKR
ncbi:MAG: hypothetical protein HHAS10_00700 [Candidatus Altimarinota bacterium]